MKVTFSFAVFVRRSVLLLTFFCGGGALFGPFAHALPRTAAPYFSVEPVADLGLRPAVPISTLPRGAVRVGDRIFFFASDEVSRSELWTTDGTNAGTRRIRDVSALGVDSSVVSGFGLVAARDRAFFQTVDPLAGLRIWRSDGSREGTVPVFSAGLYDDLGHEQPLEIVTGAVGRDLLFLRAGEEGFVDLWRVGGSPAGARRLASLPASSAADTGTARWFEASGRAYFTLPDSTSRTLWTTDGTAAGTVRLASIPAVPTPSSQPLAVGGRLFFIGSDVDHGFELWTSDGSASGTRIVRDLAPGRRPALFETFVAGRQVLYFTISTSTGREIWQSDGTAAGTIRLHTIDGSSAALAGELRGSLLFFQSGALWRARSSASPVRLATRLSPCGGAAVSSGENLQFFQFFADDGTHGCQLWRSDGTPEGTKLAVDSLPDPSDATLFALGDRLVLFARGDPEIRVIQDDRVVPLRRPHAEFRSGAPTFLVPWQGGLAFAATDEARRAIFLSDGTGAGTRPIVFGDRWAPDFTERPRDLVPLGENLAFVSLDGVEATNSSLSNANPIHLDAPPLGSAMDGQTLFPFGGKAFWLTLSGDGRDVELRGTDGTVAGTATVRRLFEAPVTPDGEGTYVPDFCVVRAARYLAFFFPISRNEIWTTDGTAAGTREAFDLEQASGDSSPEFLQSGVAFGDGMLFTSWGTQSSPFLWRTDDSALGAHPIVPLQISPLVHRWTAAGRLAFFTAQDAGGVEPWVTDGTAGGTHRLRDIVRGPRGSFPRDLTVVGDRLFFTADDGTSGRELWSSDGTTAGTARVVDLVPGPGGSFPQKLTTLFADSPAPVLVFAADDGVHGLEPWLAEADGTGVRMLADVAPGFASSSPAEFLSVGSRVFFAATTRAAGRELWKATRGALESARP